MSVTVTVAEVGDIVMGETTGRCPQLVACGILKACHRISTG